jgi:hypothetical protein
MSLWKDGQIHLCQVNENKLTKRFYFLPIVLANTLRKMLINTNTAILWKTGHAKGRSHTRVGR